jgi:hypothetical protein
VSQSAVAGIFFAFYAILRGNSLLRSLPLAHDFALNDSAENLICVWG